MALTIYIELNGNVFQKHFQRTTKRFNIRENYESFLLTPFIIFIAELKINK
jgi:hypothetical protein